MHKLFIKNILAIAFVLLCLVSFSQDSGTFKVAKRDSTTFKGIGIGIEMYSGHEEVSKLFKFKRSPIEEYKRGLGVYANYFYSDYNRKFSYYIDGGLVFWKDRSINNIVTIEQRSEILQFTGKYRIGKFAIVGRIGGLLSHYTTNTAVGIDVLIANSSTFELSTGLGINIPVHQVAGLNIVILVNKIDQYYFLSGTLIVPIYPIR